MGPLQDLSHFNSMPSIEPFSSSWFLIGFLTQSHPQARPLTQDLLFLSAQRTEMSFYFPIGKFAPTYLFMRSSSLHSEDQTLWLHEVKGRSLGSQILETRWPVNTEFSLYPVETFLITISVLVIPRKSSYRLPIPDTPKLWHTCVSWIFHFPSLLSGFQGSRDRES